MRITCEPSDDLHTIFGRTVIAGADAYVRVMERYLTGKLEGIPQDLTRGREFRGSDLTIGPKLVARRRLTERKKKNISVVEVINDKDGCNDITG